MKIRRILFNIIIVQLAILFLLSGYLVFDYLQEGKTQQKQFNELAAMVEQVKQQNVSENSEPAVEDRPVLETTPDMGSRPVMEEEDDILPEYLQIYEANTDFVGWLKIDNTKINYPVMHTPEIRDHYLTRDFYGEHSSRGCLYVREECDVFTPSDNVTIYGHNMRDGSMFADLDAFIKREFWEENGVFSFDTLTEHHTYQIFAVFKTTGNLDDGFAYHQFVNGTEDEFNSFIATCKSLAYYDTGITPVYGDKILCLSTCEYTRINGRFVVAAVRIS